MAPRRKVAKKAAKKNPLKKHFKGAGRKVMASMKRRYGKRAKRVFYATEAKYGLLGRLPNPDETDLVIESTPLAESFCVERLDIHTQETKPIATDLTASEAKTVASALTQNHGEGAFFNVEPERGGIEEDVTANPSRSEFTKAKPIFRITNDSGFYLSSDEFTSLAAAKKEAKHAAEYRKKTAHVMRLRQSALTYNYVNDKVVATVRASSGNPSRNNPDSQTESERLYKTFHGADPKFVTDVRTELFSHDSYAKLGDLISFTVIGDDGREYDTNTPNPDADPKENVVSLAASPSGRQLYFVGGDQEINPGAFGIKGHAAHKDLICLGRLKAMCYRAAKEMHNFEVIDYTHKSGENLSPSGKRYMSKDALPYLNYDALNKQLSVAGGAYFITGRGIEN